IAKAVLEGVSSHMRPARTLLALHPVGTALKNGFLPSASKVNCQSQVEKISTNRQSDIPENPVPPRYHQVTE
ncbi:MAG: hypothetical protein Q4Q58_06120, partial [Thermoplasmata archaeon]|nr:hypothetical protein [Thermoplasmata archaeon]